MAEDILQFDTQVTLWANIAAKKLVIAVGKNKIGKTGALEQSITQEVANQGGDVYKATIKYLTYGRFVDMGTGRGFYRGATGTAAFALYRNANGTTKVKVNRQPKAWYSKTIYREVKILTEKLLANLSEKTMETLKARLRRINSHSSNPAS